MNPDDNPYTPGAGARPPALVGRDSDVDAFRSAIARLGQGRHARSIIISGLRGVGKTVLLGEFHNLARESGWTSTGVLECSEADALPMVIGELAHRALRRLNRGRRASEALARAAGALGSFGVSIDEAGRWKLGLDSGVLQGVADSGDSTQDIIELLQELGRAAEAHGTGVALLLDEMQLLGRGDLASLCEVFHRFSQETTPLLLGGAGLPPLSVMLRDAKPYAERLFRFLAIEDLPPAVAQQALALPAVRANVRFQPEAMREIVKRSGGYPYFLQQWGEAAWNEAEGPVITLPDVLDAADLVSQELDQRFFLDRYKHATEAERIYMAALADLGDGAHGSGEIARHLGMSARQVSVRREGLLAKGLIYNPVDLDLDFTVPAFADFVRRVHPFDPNERPRRGRRAVTRKASPQ